MPHMPQPVPLSSCTTPQLCPPVLLSYTPTLSPCPPVLLSHPPTLSSCLPHHLQSCPPVRLSSDHQKRSGGAARATPPSRLSCNRAGLADRATRQDLIAVVDDPSLLPQ